MFYIGAGFAIVSIPLVFMLDVEVERNKKSLIKTAKAVMGMIDVDVFILVQVIIGFCWGFHATFVTIYVIDELGASKTLLGNATKMFLLILQLQSTTILYCFSFSSAQDLHLGLVVSDP